MQSKATVKNGARPESEKFPVPQKKKKLKKRKESARKAEKSVFWGQLVAQQHTIEIFCATDIGSEWVFYGYLGVKVGKCGGKNKAATDRNCGGLHDFFDDRMTAKEQSGSQRKRQLRERAIERETERDRETSESPQRQQKEQNVGAELKLH